MNHQNKTAIVTGGGIRLGREISLSLARAGFNIVLHYDSSSEAAEETAHEIAACNVQVMTLQANFNSDVASYQKFFTTAVQYFGQLDVLINSAAIFEKGDINSTNEDLWDRHFAINLKAPFFLAQAFSQALPDDALGQIINIADWRGTQPDDDYLAYSLTKNGIITLTKQLARILAPAVRVNCVAPGAILPAPNATEAEFQQLSLRTPLKRTGSPADVTSAILFLLQSEFVTGEILHVAGGEQL